MMTINQIAIGQAVLKCLPLLLAKGPFSVCSFISNDGELIISSSLWRAVAGHLYIKWQMVSLGFHSLALVLSLKTGNSPAGCLLTYVEATLTSSPRPPSIPTVLSDSDRACTTFPTDPITTSWLTRPCNLARSPTVPMPKAIILMCSGQQDNHRIYIHAAWPQLCILGGKEVSINMWRSSERKWWLRC